MPMLRNSGSPVERLTVRKQKEFNFPRHSGNSFGGKDGSGGSVMERGRAEGVSRAAIQPLAQCLHVTATGKEGSLKLETVIIFSHQKK